VRRRRSLGFVQLIGGGVAPPGALERCLLCDTWRSAGLKFSPASGAGSTRSRETLGMRVLRVSRGEVGQGASVVVGGVLSIGQGSGTCVIFSITRVITIVLVWERDSFLTPFRRLRAIC
jgi:hypothetical protein